MRTEDTSQLERVIRELYCQKPVRVYEAGVECPARVIQFSEGHIHLEHHGPPDPRRNLLLDHNEHVMLLECRLIERINSDQEKIRPIRLHIRKKTRQQPRVNLSDEHANTGHIHVRDLMPISAVTASFAMVNDRRDRILEVYTNAIQERLHASVVQENNAGEGTVNTGIVLRKSARLDHRMRPMQQHHKAIYAPQRFEEGSWQHEHTHTFIPYADYRLLRTYDDISGAFLSEISTPLWFKNRIIIGYVRAIATVKLEYAQYEFLRTMTLRLASDLQKHDCMPENPATCVVLDVSKSGLGIVHPAARIVKSFMPGENTLLDLYRDREHMHTFTATIRNVRAAAGGAHRVGLEFNQVNADQHEFLEQIIAIAHPVGNSAGQTGSERAPASETDSDAHTDQPNDSISNGQ
ncbi:MAG: PilZ domain-containing protein [Leptospiraceae bacterium]|nr:PilZ domain-containing protein [Leptospiraceae bacterium]